MRRLDNKRELIEYFKKNLAKNYTEESLKFALMSQGYSRTAIDQALAEAHKEIAKTAPILKERPVIKYELFNEKNQPIKSASSRILGKVKFFFKGKKL